MTGVGGVLIVVGNAGAPRRDTDHGDHAHRPSWARPPGRDQQLRLHKSGVWCLGFSGVLLLALGVVNVVNDLGNTAWGIAGGTTFVMAFTGVSLIRIGDGGVADFYTRSQGRRNRRGETD
ncbi:hypothetical protein ALI22I_20410 [Saccharothrix sp. ALI-22-I]|uniref:hypothetical protein n=1 Tax=Saccharothrix sp. ALI-22-I TaxID=1933778 RepID=UPI00097BA848|nr:hypothetical protein [Saccharothrix sp. ALI-22-I]ONI88104.1 hypothetical protein ALI22I_20410 [Saccharothrix sp. ALI-22-I]